MKIAIIHPFKHHAYNSMAGIIKSGADVIGLMGFYNNGDVLDRLLANSKYKSLIRGYSYSKIDYNVKTNLFIKLLFLINKLLSNRIEKIYLFIFQLWCITQIRNVQCIHVLQDYCNMVIRYAKKHNIMIVYEQIIAYDIQQFIEKKRNCKDSKKLLREKENLDIAKYILVPSNFVKNSIVNSIESKSIKEKIIIIPYGANVTSFKHIIRKYDGKRPLNILTIASVSKRKGLEYLINAIEKFNNNEIRLTFIGAWNSKERNLFDRLKKNKNINYIGTVPHSEIEVYFKRNDIFLLPSLAEGSSLSVYEALSSGMPCIVTENVGSIVENNVDGYIVNVKDSKSIENAINIFLKKPNMVETMSNNAHTKILKYTWDRYEEEISKLYINKLIRLE